MSIQGAILQLFKLVELIVVIRFLLTWFPNVDWYKQPFKLLNDIVEPVWAPFRRIIPPIGGMDISPIVLLLFLDWVLQPIILWFCDTILRL